MISMNTMLAKVEHAGSSFNKMIAEYTLFFKNKQSMFRGFKKTFKPREGFNEDSRYMGTVLVTTTVNEKLDWFEENAIPYLKDVFSVEATNSRGAERTELVVDGISFGKLTALDLMRLKIILTNKDMESMYSNIPVRSDSEVWEPCTNPEYEGREVYQTPMTVGVVRTSESEGVILKDPNLDPAHLPSNYNAKVTVKKKTVDTGDYTSQMYTGEWTQRERAELLRRRSKLLAAVTVALKKINDNGVDPQNLDVECLIEYLHGKKK